MSQTLSRGGERERQHARLTAATLNALHELAIASGTRGVGAVARLAADHARALLGVDAAVVFSHDDEWHQLVPVGETDSAIPEVPVLPGEGAIGLAFNTGLPVVIDDYQAWEHAVPASASRGMVSAIAVPLIAGERPIGALGVWTYSPRTFTAEEEQLLTLFAAQVAPALEAARLNQQRDATARIFGALHELAVAAGGMHDAAEVAALCVDSAAHLLHADGAILTWWDAEAGLLTPLAEIGPRTARGTGVRAGEGANGVAYQSKQAVVVADYAAWPHASPSGRDRGIRSCLAVPLVVRDRAVGSLGVQSAEPREFLPADVELLRLFAAQIAPALEAARLIETSAAQVRELQSLHDSLQERARVFAALHELAVAAGGLLDPAGLGQLMSERARELLGVDRVFVSVYDPESGTLRTEADSAGESEEWPHPVSPGHGINGLAFARGETVRVDDYLGWSPGVEWARKRGFRSAIAMPLIANGRKLGTISAVANHIRAFNEDDERLLSMLVSQLAPALVGASLHAELTASERALRAIYDTASLAIARNDLDGRLVWMNQAGRELFGYSEAELRDLDRGGLLAPEDADADKDLFAELVAGRLDRYRLERRYLKKDGSRFWGDVTVGLVRRPDGGPDFYYAMVEDITERKAAEQALRESEERFRGVFDRAAIGIAHLDLDGRVIEANPALNRILEHGENALRGQPFRDLVHRDDRSDLHLERLAAGEASEQQVEVRYISASGAEVWGNTIVSGVRDGAGRPRFLIVMVEDVTLRRAHQAALEHRALHDPLTDLPNRSLLEDRLQQAILAARRDHEVGAVLVIDLDGFKQVNDQHGHHCGDELLRQIGERIRGELRGSDTVARLGGDEFAVVLPNIGGAAGATSATLKLTAALDAPFEVEGQVVTVAASIGAALFPLDGEDPDQLMRRADANMYDRKRGRR